MATYLDMQVRIDDELDRGGSIMPQIRKAILSAVKFYARKSFWFTETSFTFATVQGQRTYTSSDAAAIATSPSIEILNGTFNGTRSQIHKKPFSEIDARTSQTTSYGEPEEWAYQSQTIWLYPIPDAAYTITAYHIPTLTELSSDSDSNAWTNDAEAMIRARAKWDLVKNVIRGPEMIEELTTLKGEELEEFVALINETASRKGTGFSRPTQF